MPFLKMDLFYFIFTYLFFLVYILLFRVPVPKYLNNKGTGTYIKLVNSRYRFRTCFLVVKGNTNIKSHLYLVFNTNIDLINLSPFDISLQIFTHILHNHTCLFLTIRLFLILIIIFILIYTYYTYFQINYKLFYILFIVFLQLVNRELRVPVPIIS